MDLLGCGIILKPSSILGLHDFCMKLISYFSTNILTKRSIKELFVITQQEDENTRAYL